jgi:hypothetical protein
MITEKAFMLSIFNQRDLYYIFILGCILLSSLGHAWLNQMINTQFEEELSLKKWNGMTITKNVLSISYKLT